MKCFLEQCVTFSGSTIEPVTALLCLILLTGCGSETDPKKTVTGRVNGTVTYNDTPLTEGLVNISSDSQSVLETAEIDYEGYFEFENPIATGDYRIYFSPPPPEAGQPRPQNELSQKIPEKYRSANTTDLKATIISGTNQLSLQLSD